MKRIACPLIVVALLAVSGSALADDALGLWVNEKGDVKVKIEQCGDALCGVVAWLKPGAESKAKIGQRVLLDMRPDGADAWSGKAIKDDKVYAGTMSVVGRSLKLSGCLVGGFLCKSSQWTRSS